MDDIQPEHLEHVMSRMGPLLTEADHEALLDACVRPEDVVPVIAWAENAAADHALLEAVLGGQMRIVAHNGNDDEMTMEITQAGKDRVKEMVRGNLLGADSVESPPLMETALALQRELHYHFGCDPQCEKRFPRAHQEGSTHE